MGLGVALIAADPSDVSDDKVYELLKDSTLVFTGSVVQMKASNMASIKSQDDTMTVVVKKVESSNQEALKKFGPLEGKELTVVASSALRAGLEKDISAVFFVDPLVYEKNIAVSAKAVLIPNKKTAEPLYKDLAAAALRKSETPLQSSIGKADLIITGHVEAIRNPARSKDAGAGSSARRSELVGDGQRWKEAVVRVRTVEKDTSGAVAPGGQIVIVIPAMRDCLAAQPQRTIVIGLPGIWLLHKNQFISIRSNVLSKMEESESESQLPQSYSGLDPAGFQSDNPDNLTRIQRMIRETKR